MKRLLSGLAVLALLATPATAQTLSRADVVAQCAVVTPAACAELLAAYLATLPPAAQLAAYNSIVAELAEDGVTVALTPPAPPAETEVRTFPAPTATSGGGTAPEASPT